MLGLELPTGNGGYWAGASGGGLTQRSDVQTPQRLRGWGSLTHHCSVIKPFPLNHHKISLSPSESP